MKRNRLDVCDTGSDSVWRTHQFLSSRDIHEPDEELRLQMEDWNQAFNKVKHVYSYIAHNLATILFLIVANGYLTDFLSDV